MKRTALLLGLIALCAALSVLALLRACWAVVTNTERAWSIILMFDRLGNVAANDNSGALISTRAHLARRDGKRWGMLLADALDALDPGHCAASYKRDMKEGRVK